MPGPPDYGGYPVDHNYPGHSYNTGIPWSSHPDNPNILPDPGYKPLAVETGANTRQRQMRTTSCEAGSLSKTTRLGSWWGCYPFFSALTRGLYNCKLFETFLKKYLIEFFNKI
jgi:hypothetical protein